MAQVQIIEAADVRSVHVIGGPTPGYPDVYDGFGKPANERPGDRRRRKARDEEYDQIDWLHRHGIAVDDELEDHWWG